MEETRARTDAAQRLRARRLGNRRPIVIAAALAAPSRNKRLIVAAAALAGLLFCAVAPARAQVESNAPTRASEPSVVREESGDEVTRTIVSEPPLAPVEVQQVPRAPAVPQQAPGAPGQAPRAALVPLEALKRGGHVILMRFPGPDRVQESEPVDLANCEAQQKLSEGGKGAALAIGAAFQTLKIPVGQVLSSQYCAVQEFSHAAFGNVQAAEVLLPSSYIPVPGAPVPPDPDQRRVAVKQLLATPPEAGKNTVLVAHGQVVRDVAGIEMAAGESAIYRPDGQGGSSLVVRLQGYDWLSAEAQATAKPLSPLPSIGDLSTYLPGAVAIGAAFVLLLGLALRRTLRRA